MDTENAQGNNGNNRISRAVIGAIGIGLVGIGLAGGPLHLRHFQLLGAGQILAIIFGLLLLLVVALAPAQFAAFYRGASISVLNTILLVAAIELIVILGTNGGEFLSGNSVAITVGDSRAALPYYKAQPWSEVYWREYADSKREVYEPYTIWRRAAFSGETINIDERGIRMTPGATCEASNVYRVFVFGGSTLWGTGAPDWGTIPAYIQQNLPAPDDRPLCVVNFGETAYTSTQGVLRLVTQLEIDNIPDVVIYYDGVNDVLSISQSLQPNLHQNLSEISSRFEQNALLTWLQNSQSVQLLELLVPSAPDETTAEADLDDLTAELGAKVAATYLNNNRIVAALAEAYGFDYHFFWQPVIFAGDKPLAPEERAMQAGVSASVAQLFEATYREMQDMAPEFDNLDYIADVFDEQDEAIWIDFMHLTPPGNQLVAERMIAEIGG